MKQASAHRKERAVKNRPSKDEREARKQALSEWIRFQNLAQFYEEEMGIKCEMRFLPDRPAVPLFSLEVDGVPLNELWEKDPDKAYVAWLSPPQRAEWTEELRKQYKVAQARLMYSLSVDDREIFSNVLTLYGPRLLAKDPLDAGVVLSTLDRLWRDLSTPSEQDREERHFYDLSTDTQPSLAEGGGLWEMNHEELRSLTSLTDTEIQKARGRGRQRIQEFLREIGKAFAAGAQGRPELAEEEKPKSKREAVSRTLALNRLLARYKKERAANTPAKQAYLDVVTDFVNSRHMKDRRRKSLILGKFDQEILKKDPSLSPLINCKIWPELLWNQNPN